MRTHGAVRQLNDKIKSRAALKRVVAALKKSGKKVVFTNGCFDLLHYGHVRYLERARRTGDVLIVALNSDASVRAIKGSARPLVPQDDRAAVIAALESVDFVTIFDERTPLEVIRALKPNVLIKGADWGQRDIVGRDVVAGEKGVVKTVPLEEGRSTTALIKKIASIFSK